MAKVTIRIPTEAYAYAEVEYESIGEYKEKHPEFAKAMTEVRAKALAAAKEAREKEAPF